MQFQSSALCSLVNGKLIGQEVNVTGFNSLEDAVHGDISFCDGEDYLSLAIQSSASVIITNNTIETQELLSSGKTIITVENPRIAIATLLWHYKSITEKKTGTSENASVHSSVHIPANTYVGHATIGQNVKMGENCEIHDGVTLGDNVSLGNSSILHAGVMVLANCSIGNHVTIQANAVIGSDGFGFVPNSENNYMKVPHIGTVVIEDHVEIGAGTCIDRATMGETRIKKGVKLDNLIQVAHNVEIGENTVIAAQTGIAGSTTIGKNCMIGGQVGIVGHIEIADEVKIAAQSGIGASIKEKGAIFQGSPAFGIRDYKMSYVGFRKLPELLKQVHQLEKEIKELKQRLSD